MKVKMHSSQGVDSARKKTLVWRVADGKELGL